MSEIGDAAAIENLTRRLKAAEATRDAARRLVDEWTDDLATFPASNIGARYARAAVELCIKELTAVLIERDDADDGSMTARPATWVCDGCMRTVERSEIADHADGEHVLCAGCIGV